MGLQLFLSAFLDLSSCRTMGMAPGPIPWNAVHDYCDRLELDEEDREDMHFHVTRMDQVYLDHVAQKRAENN